MKNSRRDLFDQPALSSSILFRMQNSCRSRILLGADRVVFLSHPVIKQYRIGLHLVFLVSGNTETLEYAHDNKNSYNFL